jgi:spore coat polysaccharide biosynthesis protein SpsF
MTDASPRSSRDIGDNPNIVATIEARMNSERLPGKVLADVHGMPMLAMMIRRLQASQTVSQICVATTSDAKDDQIVDLAEELEVAWFRGSEDDVLERVLGAANELGADLIVETTGDCPMIDAALLDACVLAFMAGGVDYSTNCLVRTFPIGLDVRVFPTWVLAEVADLTTDPSDREHVSLYIYEHPERYRLRNVPAVGVLNQPTWRWTVDTSPDLELVRSVVGPLGHSFTAREAAEFLDEHPEIVGLNENIMQKPVR